MFNDYSANRRVENLGTDNKPFLPRTGGESTGVYLTTKHLYHEISADYEFKD